MLVDIYGQYIEEWDIILIVSANGKLELALVVDVVNMGKSWFPTIQRFNEDCTLRKNKYEFLHCGTKSYVLEKRSVPAKAWNLRCKLMEDNNG